MLYLCIRIGCWGLKRHFALVFLLNASVSLDTDSYPKGPEILYNSI